jgi:hypothetical protein
VLSFLLLVSTTGQPLPPDAVARLAPFPAALTFRPTDMTTWRADGDHVALVAWADEPDPWHVGPHGITLATGHPWPLASRFTAPAGTANELTSRLGAADDPGLLSWLTGDTTVVRVRPDGTGLVAAPPLGGGQVVVAQGPGLLAVADRAAVAAGALGGVVRELDLPDLLTGTLLGDRTAVRGTARLRPGASIRLRGRDGAKIVDGPAPWHGLEGARVDDLLPDAADDVARLLDLAADHPGPVRVVELGATPASQVIAAALAASGRLDAFVLRAAGPGHHAAAAARLAGALGVPLEAPLPRTTGGEATDGRVRAAVARVEAAVAPVLLGPDPPAGVRGERGLLVPCAGVSVLGPGQRPDVGRLLTTDAAAHLQRLDQAWSDGLPRDSGAADRVLEHLERRWPRTARATADLLAGADVLDPLAVPSIARLAVVAAREGTDATSALVAGLHPPLATVPLDVTVPTADPADWRSLAPVLEAHLLGHAREALRDVVALDEVEIVVRSSTAPDHATRAALQGALALAVWAAGTDMHRPTVRAVPRPRVTVAPPTTPPVLVTGVTSRSLLELTGVGVPLDETAVDALLGTRVDAAVRDLVHRLLLAVGATPGHLPADLDERLAGPATAPFAAAATALLARRGGTLVDPRLALTLPFWSAHVAVPRVVLVAERPPDLAARTGAQLPGRDLLGWWIDAVTAAAASEVDVRIVDPGDLLDLDVDEASPWEGLDVHGTGGDVVRVARTVDSLVREVELEAARPLLRTIRRSRAGASEDLGPRSGEGPAAAPLRVVDELWERAVRADADLGVQRAAAADLEARLTRANEEVDELRGRRGLRAAWRVLTGND